MNVLSSYLHILSFPMRYRFSLGTMLCLLLCLPFVPTLQAQDESFEDDGTLDARFLNSAKVRSTPEVRNKLRRVEKALQAQRWNEALELFVELTENYPSDVVKIGPGRFIGVRDAVLKRMRNLPDEARVAFRAQFDGRIRRELDVALARHDLLQLRRIGYDMFLSSHANMALFHLMELQAERGNLKAAVEAAETLRDRQQKTDSLQPGVAARLGELYAMHGDSAALKKWRVQLRDSKDMLFVRGEALTLTDYLAALQVSEQAPVETLGRATWKRYGGDLDNNVRADASIDLKSRKWRCEVPNLQKPPTARRAQIIRSSGLLFDRSREMEVVAPLHPVVMNNLAYFRSNDRVFCYNLFTSRLHWSWKPDDVSHYFYEDENTLSTSLIYKDLLVVAIETPYTRELPMYSRTFFVKPYVPDRYLVAFNRFTGEVVWTQNQNTTHPLIRRCSYPSSPIVYNDLLYTVATTEIGENVTQSLICLDPSNGRCLWSLELCTGMAESNMFGRNLRESVPTQPVVVDDLFIFGTNYGAVIAVDLSSHDVEWITYYQVAPIPRAQGLELKWRIQRWGPNPLIHDNGKLFLAATDSDTLHALNASTGDIVWKRRRNSGEKFLLGVHDNVIVVSGYTQYALRADTGKKIWETVEQVTLRGRGRMTSTQIHIPTDRALVSYDVTTGKKTNSQTWNKSSEAGNLLLLPGDIAIISSTSLSGEAQATVYYDFQKLERNLIADIKEKADDPVSYYELGSIYQQSGKTMKAIDALLTGHSLAARNPEDHQTLLLELRALLYRSYLEAGRKAWQKKDASSAETYLHKAREYANRVQDHVEILLQIDGIYKKLNQVHKRIDLYQELLIQYPNVYYRFPGLEAETGLYALLQLIQLHANLPGREADTVDLLHDLTVRYSTVEIYGQPVGQFAYERIHTLIQANGLKVYRRMAEQVGVLLQNGSQEALQQILKEYPNDSRIQNVMETLRQRLSDDGDPETFAASMRGFVHSYPRSQAALHGLMHLVGSYETQGMYSNARAILLRMQRDFPDRRLTQDGVIVTVADMMETKLLSPDYQRAAAGTGTWNFQFPLQEHDKTTELKQGGVLLQIHGSHPTLEHCIFAGEIGSLHVFDGGPDKKLHSFTIPDVNRPNETLNDQPASVFLENNLMVIVCGATVIVYDIREFDNNPSACPVVWQKSFQGGLRDAAVNNGVILLNQIPRGLSTTLVALDINSGEALWNRDIGRIAERPLQISSLCAIYTVQSTTYFVDLLTGELIQKYKNSLGERTRPIAVNHRHIALIVNERVQNRIRSSLLLFDSIAAKPQWKAGLGGMVKNSDLIAGNEDIVVLTFNGRKTLAAYDMNGTMIWQQIVGSKKRSKLILGLWTKGKKLFAIIKREERQRGKLVTTVAIREIDPLTGETKWETDFSNETGDGLDVSFIIPIGNAVVLKTRSYRWESHTNSYEIFFLQPDSGKVLQHMKGYAGSVGDSFAIHRGGIAMMNKFIIQFFASKQKGR